MRRTSESRFGKFFDANFVFFYGVLLMLIVNAILLMNYQHGDALVYLNQLRRAWSDGFFRVATKLGEPEAYVVACVGLAAFSYRRAIFAIVTGAAAGVVSGLLKILFAQPRPMRWIFDNHEEVWHALNRFGEGFENWSEVSSFPSGHTASAFALYSFICFNLSRPKLLITVGCFLLALAVAISRMYLLYHFLRDVTVGAAIGVLIGMLVYYLQFRLFPATKVLDRGWWRKAPGA